MQDFYVDMSEYKDDMEKYDTVATEIFERAVANGVRGHQCREEYFTDEYDIGCGYETLWHYVGVFDNETRYKAYVGDFPNAEELTLQQVREKYPHPDYDVVSPKITPRSMACFDEVAKVIGEDKAEEELQKVLDCDAKYIDLDVDKPLIQAFEWSLTPQGGSFWAAISCDVNPYPPETYVSEQEVCSGRTATPVPTKAENASEDVTGASGGISKGDFHLLVNSLYELEDGEIKEMIIGALIMRLQFMKKEI